MSNIDFPTPRLIRETSGVDHFRHIDSGSCYHCEQLTTDMFYWSCKKHDINFGTANLNANEHAIANTAEFICDDFEKVKYESG